MEETLEEIIDRVRGWTANAGGLTMSATDTLYFLRRLRGLPSEELIELLQDFEALSATEMDGIEAVLRERCSK